METKQTLLDMLQGNINRMCVTDSAEELVKIKYYAKVRIDNLCEIRIKELEFTKSTKE